jgi:hypothetical protein
VRLDPAGIKLVLKGGASARTGGGRARVSPILYEGLRFVGVVYNLVAVGFVIMVFVIFFPRGLAGFGRSA